MRIMIVAAAALAAASCAAEDSTQVGNEAAAPAGNAVAPVAAPAAADAPAPAAEGGPAAASGGLDRAFLVGRWTETENCAEEAIEFRPDGSFVFPWGEEGQWTLEGSRLAMVGNPQTIDLEFVSPDELRATKATGNVRRWQRCA